MVTKHCLTCSKEFRVHKYRAEKANYCCYQCYWITLIDKPAHNKGKVGVFKHTKEARRKISEAGIGRVFSEETRKKISEKAKVRGMDRAVIEKSLTPEAIAKRTGPNNPRWKGGKAHKLILNAKRRALKLGADGSHSLKEWEDLKKKFGYMCLCCKKTEPTIRLTEDHIIPLTKGGTDYIDNIQPLCFSCNSRKRVKLINYMALAEITNSI